MQIKKLPVEFLLDSGLLFEINRKVLHPFGLGLELTVDEDGTVRLGQLWDCRGGIGGLVYDSTTFIDGERKLERFMQESGARTLRERQDRYGFIIQEKPYLEK